MLKNKVWQVINAWDNIDDLIFVQDRAPPQFAIVIREWLNAKFLGKWMGRRRSSKWPARSPDLMPCDFFFWGLVKRASLLNQTQEIWKNLKVEYVKL